MSKIGKKSITIPDQVKVSINGNILSMEGPKGKKEIILNTDLLDTKIENNILSVTSKNNETKKLIAQYYEALYGKIVVNNTLLDNDNHEFGSKTFGFGFFIAGTEKLPFQSRSSSDQLEDFKTILALRKRIIDPEFRLLVNKIESRCGYYLYVIQTAKELNTKLLSQLNKKEF